MTVVKFDSTSMDSLKLDVTDVKKSLSSIKSSINYLSVPSDFQYSSTLSSVATSLGDAVSKLNTFNDWIDKCKKEFDEVEKEQKEKMNAINAENITKREKIV